MAIPRTLSSWQNDKCAKMPVLEILDARGRLLPDNNAGRVVLAAMCFPTDAEGRDIFTAAYIQLALLTEEPPRPIPPEIATLVYHHGGRPGIEKRFAKEFAQGSIAGETMMRLLQLVAYTPEHASARKACYLVECGRARRRDGRGKQVAGSPASIENAWLKFKVVSHLWAAYLPLVTNSGTGMVFADDLLPELLARAKWIEGVATRHHPPAMGGKIRPVLDPTAIWSVPDSPDIPSVTLEPPALDDTELGWLTEYTHR